jgi:hypothetical protein
MKAPTCKLCRHDHWSNEPHVWTKEAPAAPKEWSEPAKQRAGSSVERKLLPPKGKTPEPSTARQRPALRVLDQTPVISQVTTVTKNVTDGHCPTCGQRLPKHQSPAEKQRAYRERKAKGSKA